MNDERLAPSHASLVIPHSSLRLWRRSLRRVKRVAARKERRRAQLLSARLLFRGPKVGRRLHTAVTDGHNSLASDALGERVRRMRRASHMHVRAAKRGLSACAFGVGLSVALGSAKSTPARLPAGGVRPTRSCRWKVSGAASLSGVFRVNPQRHDENRHARPVRTSGMCDEERPGRRRAAGARFS